jgi:pseudouridine-5'-phosphate glycosidase
VSEEVAQALRDGTAVVALESNVITHGLDYPANAETARGVEAAVRAAGAVPATVCVDGGRIVVGMGAADIERFATTGRIPKIGSRDLPVVLASGGHGATTIAASLVIADLVGIPFLASAGMGGVHRGAEMTMDISGDLVQLTRSRVALVCAGAKKVLDLGLTLEFLETHCVPVVAYCSDDFPAFYCRSSGLRSPSRLDDPAEVARAVEWHWALGNDSAVVVTTPVRPEDAIDGEEVEAVIAEACAAARRDGVRGKDITKYLMRAVDRATEGRSAKANTAVLVTTAEVAGQLAVAHAQLCRDGGIASAPAAGGGAA